MARFAGLSGPERAIESEMWFRREIAKAIAKEIAPLIARIVQLENKPMPKATTPSQQWETKFLREIGQPLKDELKKRDQRIAALESKMANWRYCGVWSEGQYETGNFVTHEGSLFACLWTTQSKPGTVDAWQLCCKRGKDGKDNVPRLPTTQRRVPVMS